MNPDCDSSRFSATDAAAVLVRWLLGALFIYTGVTKALHPEEFLKMVRQYDLVQNPLLLNSIASALPWFEVFCGVLLLAGIAVRGSALLLIFMLVPFTLAVLHRAWMIHTLQSIPFCLIKFDCGCGTGEEWICHKVPENLFFILLAVWLLFGRGRIFSARFDLFKQQ